MCRRICSSTSLLSQQCHRHVDARLWAMNTRYRYSESRQKKQFCVLSRHRNNLRQCLLNGQRIGDAIDSQPHLPSCINQQRDRVRSDRVVGSDGSDFGTLIIEGIPGELRLMTLSNPMHDGIRLLSRHSLFGVKKHQCRTGQWRRSLGTTCNCQHATHSPQDVATAHHTTSFATTVMIMPGRPVSIYRASSSSYLCLVHGPPHTLVLEGQIRNTGAAC